MTSAQVSFLTYGWIRRAAFLSLCFSLMHVVACSRAGDGDSLARTQEDLQIVALEDWGPIFSGEPVSFFLRGIADPAEMGFGDKYSFIAIQCAAGDSLLGIESIPRPRGPTLEGGIVANYWHFFSDGTEHAIYNDGFGEGIGNETYTAAPPLQNDGPPLAPSAPLVSRCPVTDTELLSPEFFKAIGAQDWVRPAATRYSQIEGQTCRLEVSLSLAGLVVEYSTDERTISRFVYATVQVLEGSRARKKIDEFLERVSF